MAKSKANIHFKENALKDQLETYYNKGCNVKPFAYYLGLILFIPSLAWLVWFTLFMLSFNIWAVIAPVAWYIVYLQGRNDWFEQIYHYQVGDVFIRLNPHLTKSYIRYVLKTQRKER